MTNCNGRMHYPMKLTSLRLLPLAIVLLLAFSGCAGKAFRDGKQALLEGEYDESVADFQRAAKKKPEKHEYRLYLQRAKIQSALFHLHKGRQMRSAGDLDGALQEFQLAVIFDPSLEGAAQEAVATQKAQQNDQYYKQAETLLKNGEPEKARRMIIEVLAGDPENRKAKSLLNEIDERLKLTGHRMEHLFKSTKPVTLEFKKTDLREVFVILSRLAGKNFILDEKIPKETVDLELKNINLLQSFELLLNLYKLKAKPLNHDTVLVFPDSSDKAKQYDDYKIKTYYLSHISAKHAVNLLRTMLKIKDIFVHEELNALVFRERPEVIQLAEQIIAATDRADSEVLFELELIEVNHSDVLVFGPSLNPNSVSLGMAKGSNIVASGLSAGDATTNLVESFSSLETLYTLPTVVFDFQKTQGGSEILSTPKIRVKNRGKAKVHVGTREPVITVTTTGETSTDSIQYVDVGVKLDIEPQIQLNNTVVTNLSLEVSSVTEKNTTANGSLALSISTTNAQTLLTLKNGERTVIGGLIRDDNTKTRKIIPLLGDLPLIGRLFTNHNKDKKKREILLSITPHILQNVDLPDASLTDLWSGSEGELKAAANFASFLTPMDPAEEEESLSEEKTVSPAGEAPAETAEAPEAPPVPDEEQSLIEVESVEEPVLPTLSESGQPSFLLTAPRSVTVGDTFEVVVGITGATDLHSASMNFSCNGDRVEVLEISQGDFLGKGGEQTRFSARQGPETRDYAIAFNLPESQAGASGDGTLAKLLCKATHAGQVLLGIEGTDFLDSQGRPMTLPARKLLFNVE